VVGYDEVLYQVDGSVNFEVGGVNVTGEVLLTVPARLTLPIMVGPIPFRIELGSSVELRSNISVENSARFAGSTTFVGDAGVQYRPDTGVKYIASFDAVDPKLARSQQTTSITGGFGTMLNFPELSVGVGLPNIAEGTGFLRFKTESVTNASFSTERDICIEASTNFGASYGGNAKFLGITVFDEEHMLFAKVGPEAHSENCEEADPADPTDPADPADAGAGGAGGD
jgi:hypothetical protein